MQKSQLQSASSNDALYSLNGARFCSHAEQRAMRWLDFQTDERICIVEAVGRDSSGNFVAAYSDFGRMSALTGVPSYIGWAQHAGFWGAEYSSIQSRLLSTQALYQQSNARQIGLCTAKIAHEISPDQRKPVRIYLYIGDLEFRVYNCIPDTYTLAGCRTRFRDSNSRTTVLEIPSQ